ncbi:MAG: response regulator [Calditrichaeota bacterium]|nr:response regulator transcription factor [Calditrichota bacterium]RQV98358.1 MAG: response regulator [Calditrichota bacterium]
MNILIVDDNARIRQAIRSLLQNHLPDATTIVECSNGPDAISLCRENLPDWILMDISMEPMNGFVTSHNISKYHPGARIVFVTQYDEPAYRQEAKNCGGCAYVLKENLLDIPGLIRNIL